MRYKVIAKRGVWNKKSLAVTSRVEFEEDSDLEYSDYLKLILKQFRDWIVSVSTVRETV